MPPIEAWRAEHQPNLKLDDFMKVMDRDELALTFDDVTLIPQYSEVKPNEVNVGSYFSRRVPLKMPFVSSAMDTVTETAMAIMMARLGGLGIIHRGMSADEQAEMVERSKFSLNVLIEHPISFKPDTKVGEILRVKAEHGYGFNSFPIVSSDGKLAGLVTGHHMTYVRDEPERTAETFMTRQLITGSKGMSPKEAYAFMKKNMLKKLPLVDENGVLAGMYDWDDLKTVIDQEGRINVDDRGQLMVGAAVGSHDYERVKKLVDKHVNVLVIDAAHADTKDIVETIKEIKRQWDVDVVAGNISTKEAAEDLIEAGADGIKVGQGPGSICTTRVVAGIGVPQITAVYYASQGARGRVPICADGGIRYSGDITKIIADGAQCVMFGSLIAGTDESPGESVLYQGKKWKRYRGMGSLGAMKERPQCRDRYGQTDSGKLTPEGVEGLRPYTGSLQDIVFMLEGGLRSGMGYVGAATILELNRKGTFKRVTNAGLTESHPHDIVITEEAPNYPGKA